MTETPPPEPPPQVPHADIEVAVKSPRRRRFLIAAGAALVLLVAAGAWFLDPYWEAAGQFEDAPVMQPSRLYGAAPVLAVDQLVDREQMDTYLKQLGYRPADEGEELESGLYRSTDDRLVIHQRSFPTAAGRVAGARLAVGFDGRRIASLERGGEATERAALDPPLIASFYGDDFKERRPIQVDELPEEVIEAVLAAEDSAFFTHPGLSFTGILRAAWVNFQEGDVSQGGSTLTQQLVKNLYLTHDRTWDRKAREAVLSVLLEMRYPKRAILQAYMNEIYLGSAENVNLIGFGAAAHAYFGKEAKELSLAEAATLAGMIRSPANYSPLADPDRAQERRDQVIGRMVELEWITAEAAAAVEGRPVRTNPGRLARRRAPYFANYVRGEASRRYGIEDLDDGGYVLLSTLDLLQQNAAREALVWGLDALENGWEKGNDASDGPLQGALVAVSPATGGILAYVGGRDYGGSQFDRVSQARRQVGSAFKPVVYATGFERRAVTPATILEDEPLTYRYAGRTWSPGNDDGQFRGPVTARRALEGSINVPTARLALDRVGLEPIIETARGLGVTAPLEPVPSLALGAFEITPLEMANVYATFAHGGQRPPVHGLQTVFDRTGEPVSGQPLPSEERVLTPQSTYLLTSLLQGVVDRGTAAGARRQGLEGPFAGKTGTTNGRRDNWFAGFSPVRVAVVWVGYDDNARTRMSGSRAAVPIWTRYMMRTRPPGGWPDFDMPDGITTAVVDPESGELATEYCPRTVTEVFRIGEVPGQECSLHRGWYRDRWGGRWGEEARAREDYREESRGAEDDRPNRIRRFFRGLFNDDEEQGQGTEEQQDDGQRPPDGPSDPPAAPSPSTGAAPTPGDAPPPA